MRSLSNKNTYQWHFSTNANMGKRSMAAILTQNNEPIYVYAFCSKSLKGADKYLGLDELVSIAAQYTEQNRVPNLIPPAFYPSDMVPYFQRPEDVDGLNGKIKRARYGVLFNILKKMPLARQAVAEDSTEIIRSLLRYEENANSSKRNINRPIKTSKTADANVKSVESAIKKKKEANILSKRIADGEKKQNDWIAEHGGPNQNYESLLNKLRFELSKLDSKSFEFDFDDDDERRYAWAWELIEKGPEMTDYEWKRLSRSMKNDPRLDSWIFHHPRTPIPCTMDDIAKLFGGKLIEKNEVAHASNQ